MQSPRPKNICAEMAQAFVICSTRSTIRRVSKRCAVCIAPSAIPFRTRMLSKTRCTTSPAFLRISRHPRSTVLGPNATSQHPIWRGGMAPGSAKSTGSFAMPDDLRCVLQIIKEKRLRDHPGSFGPEQDICDITLWLNHKFPISKARVLVDRLYTQRSREIVGLSVTGIASQSLSMTAIALEAFLALGYSIQHTSGDSYRCPSCLGHHSKHEAIKAFARIESALRAQRSR